MKTSKEDISASTFSQPMSRRTAIATGLKLATIGGTALAGAGMLTTGSVLPAKAAALRPKTFSVMHGLPAAAASGNRTVAVVTTPDGGLAWTSWQLGEGAPPWQPVVIDGPIQYTDVAPAVSFRTTAGGTVVWLAIKDSSDNQIYETLQEPDGRFGSWLRIPGITTNVSPVVSDGNLSVGSPVMASLSTDEVTYINVYLHDQPPIPPPPGYWKAVSPTPWTTMAPAISIVGRGSLYMFLVASVVNFSGPNNRLVLYQGDPYKPDQLSISYMGFDSNLSPAMSAANNRTVIVAVDPDGALFYNWWDLGGGSHGWLPLGGNVRTNFTPAVALVDKGNYMFVYAQGLDGNLYINQAVVGGSIVGWLPA